MHSLATSLGAKTLYTLIKWIMQLKKVYILQYHNEYNINMEYYELVQVVEIMFNTN